MITVHSLVVLMIIIIVILTVLLYKMEYRSPEQNSTIDFYLENKQSSIKNYREKQENLSKNGNPYRVPSKINLELDSKPIIQTDDFTDSKSNQESISVLKKDKEKSKKDARDLIEGYSYLLALFALAEKSKKQSNLKKISKFISGD